MFLLNEKVVYPGYGVALIHRKVERIVAGSMTTFFELKFFHKDMTILVPDSRLEGVGIRRLSSLKEIKEMLQVLSEPCTPKKTHSIDTTILNWNKRNKNYQFKLRSGDLFKISAIYKDLHTVSQDKELSFGERNLLQQIEELLIEEIAAVCDIDRDASLSLLRKPFIKKNQTIPVSSPSKSVEAVV